MEKFKKLLEKKRQAGKSLDGVERDAKMSAVQTLKDFANDAMKDKMGDMKKVSVASDSKEGLVEGMEKAKQMVQGKEGFGELPDMEDDEKAEMDMADEDEGGYDKEMGPYAEANQQENGQDNKRDSPPEENEEEDMSEDELNAKLEALMAKKKKMGKK